MNPALRPFWNKLFSFNWKFGLCLVLVVCITRFLLVLEANESQNYSLIGLVMTVSALVPFIFLSREGLKTIGIRASGRPAHLLVALLSGIAFSMLLFLIGKGLYGNSNENWYVYIGNSYNIPDDISDRGRNIMFLVMAATGMTFSPLGEEFFFRGIVHSSFATSAGSRNASVIDSLAFALTHISHFGLVFVNGSWSFLPVPALIWVSAMFVVSLLFFRMKRLTNSIWGAVLSHAGFNLGMIFTIFYML